MRKQIYQISIFQLFLFLMFSCSNTTSLDRVLELAGDNRTELERVLMHYDSLNDFRKKTAAEFLIANMGYNKYCYKGEVIQHYDVIFHLYDSLRNAGIIVGDPPVIKKTWNSLLEEYGPIDPLKLTKQHDYKTITADFLIQNIDQAFYAWERSPYYKEENFDLFCEYILPHRIQHEPYEEYRQGYYDTLHILVDTAQCVNEIIKGFHQEIRWNRHYRPSETLWDYPIEFPISKMEIGRRGACRHLTTYTALYMRACGLPVTIDRAIWANRNQGHSWNVLFVDKDSIFPFDALASNRIEFVYVPAKIFRKTYSYDLELYHKLNKDDVPPIFFIFDEKDVTHEYCRTFDISISIKHSKEEYKKKKQGVICVFDNRNWRPVYWGDIQSGEMFFKNMPTDIAYVGAYYDQGKIIPATSPFVMDSIGTIRELKANNDSLITLHLERKYPRFKRIEDHAWGLRRTTAEAANNSQFKNSTVFFDIYDRTFHVADSIISNTRKYRYVRFQSALHRNADYAEVEFYGKKSPDAPEVKLSGTIIGCPLIKEDDEHPYTHAMDGDLETYFNKPKNEIGWVGLDLGKENESIITRIRFCPRSDTNFILEGDEYELLYWDDNQWQSMGRQKAPQYNFIEYESVPSETMYLLRNHTRGKEERIFTYVDGKQLWW